VVFGQLDKINWVMPESCKGIGFEKNAQECATIRNNFVYIESFGGVVLFLIVVMARV
jgi:hypothetical protein